MICGLIIFAVCFLAFFFAVLIDPEDGTGPK